MLQFCVERLREYDWYEVHIELRVPVDTIPRMIGPTNVAMSGGTDGRESGRN